MFDIAASELLLIAVVAILVIGPKDMPRAMRLAGRWMAKARRVSGHFRTGLDTMIREAELEEMEREWREQNARIMAQFPDQAATSDGRAGGAPDADDPAPAPSAAEARLVPLAQDVGAGDRDKTAS